MTVICPSCAASNYCPDGGAGLTICCRKCKTQVTTPEDAAGPPRLWLRSRYWLMAILLEAIAAAGLVASLAALVAAKPPAGLPLLEPTSGTPQLAAPGGTVRLEWQTDRLSAGGHYRVVGQNVKLTGPGEFVIQDVRVAEDWSPEVFRAEHPPAPKPIELSFSLRLPPDEILEGERVTVRIVASLEFPGYARPGGPVSLQQATVTHERSLLMASREERAILGRYLRGRRLLNAAAGVSGALVALIPLAAGLLAVRHINVQCPTCGRITACTYFVGGHRLHISACPHWDTRVRDKAHLPPH